MQILNYQKPDKILILEKNSYATLAFRKHFAPFIMFAEINISWTDTLVTQT